MSGVLNLCARSRIHFFFIYVNMKLIRFYLPLLVLSLYLTSCAPAIENSEAPNALVANPRALTINTVVPDSGKPTTWRLNCGCSFWLKMASASGDTSRIDLLPREALLDSSVTMHTITFRGRAGTPSGSYNAKYVLYTYDYDTRGNFYDTVSVALNVP
jgi:hypothetical protein